MPNICNCDLKNKKCNGIRKMTVNEKKLFKEHFKNVKHSNSMKMKMLNTVCRGKEVKKSEDLVKLHKQLF